MHRGKSQGGRNRGISLTSKETFKEKENNAMESNRMRRVIGSGNCESSSKAKINLVITQAAGVNRRNR